MRVAIFGIVLCLAGLAGLAVASPESDAEYARKVEAARQRMMARQKEMDAKAATRPATAPAGPTSRPAEAKRSAKVVFLIDASGSMISLMADIKDQVSRAIAELQPSQSFGIVLFNDNTATVFNKTLVPATEANQRRAYQYIAKIDTTSTGDPAPGIKAAAALRPDVVWLLTDGDFPDNQAALSQARTAAKTGGFRINTTVRYTERGGEPDLLRRISHETGGICLDKDGKPLPPLEDPKPSPIKPPAGPSILKE